MRNMFSFREQIEKVKKLPESKYPQRNYCLTIFMRSGNKKSSRRASFKWSEKQSGHNVMRREEE